MQETTKLEKPKSGVGVAGVTGIPRSGSILLLLHDILLLVLRAGGGPSPRSPKPAPVERQPVCEDFASLHVLCLSASGAPVCAKAVVWEAVLYFHMGTQPATHPPQTETLSCDTEAFRTQCPVCVLQAEPGRPPKSQDFNQGGCNIRSAAIWPTPVNDCSGTTRERWFGLRHL